MKILKILLFALCSIGLFSQEVDVEQAESKSDINYSSMNGLTLSISAFNYFSVGLGYNWGKYSVFDTHFSATVFGTILEYKTLKELHLRTYARLYGGSAGILLGISNNITTDFDSFSIGLCPEIGIGFDSMNLFYRYNFYLNSDYNCHEIVFCLYPINRK